MKVLHIAAHYGGGVGAVVNNLIEHDKSNDHQVIDLSSHGLAFHLIPNYDIVILHFWNYPSIYEFLILNPLPPCRLIVWAHCNCLNPPYVIPERLVDMCDRFIFTSPVSYQAESYQSLSDKQKEKFGVIWSVANLTKFYNIKKVPHDGFNIGYVGTIDYNSKLHPDFVDMCAAIDIPDAKFIVVGGGPDLELLKKQVQEKGLAEKFTITGLVSQDELLNYYAQMDVFGYPLYEKHIGTCEQVIGEAMAAGVVPIVLDNEPEKFIVDNWRTGIQIEKEKYTEGIKWIYLQKDNLFLHKESVKAIYDTDKMISAWQSKFTAIMQKEKSAKSWYGKHTGSFLFLESLGQYAKAFHDGDRFGIVELLRNTRQWKSESKGSIKQYARYFPEDEILKSWNEIIGDVK